MLPKNYQKCSDRLVQEFGVTVRKLWNHKVFRAHVSPHALLQAAALHPEHPFKQSMAADALEFLLWLLNTLHLGLARGKKRSSIIHETFQGEVEIVTEKDQREV